MSEELTPETIPGDVVATKAGVSGVLSPLDSAVPIPRGTVRAGGQQPLRFSPH